MGRHGLCLQRDGTSPLHPDTDRPMMLDAFGMDTISLAGTLDAKLDAMAAGGFRHVMLSATDLAGYPGGEAGVLSALRARGLRATGFQVLRDAEGLTGAAREHRMDVAQVLLGQAREVQAPLLLACSSTSPQASGAPHAIARDLRALGELGAPLGVRVAYEGLSWGRYVSTVPTAWDRIREADCANLGIVLDSYHWLAARTPVAALEAIDPTRIFLVQLADFLVDEVPTPDDRRETARHARVFPGEGVHSAELLAFVRRLESLGYRGDYSFEVFNDDYQLMPLDAVVERALRSARWLVEHALEPTRRGSSRPAP